MPWNSVRVGPPVTFRSFRHVNFRRYFLSQAASAIGTWLQLVAQTLLVLQLTGSPTALGLLMTFQYAPSLLLGAWAGVLLDRHDKRRAITVTTAVMALSALVLGVAALSGNASLPLVYLVALFLGIANAFDAPGRRALVNELVSPDDLNNAVNLYATLVTTARLVGPAIAGLLVTTVGIGWCFVLNALSFIAPMVALHRMDREQLHSAPRVARQRGQLLEGLRYAASNDELRLPLILLATIGLLGFNFQIHLPLLAIDGLGSGEAGYTMLSSAFGMGCLVGALTLASRQIITQDFLGTAVVSLGAATALLAFAPTLVYALPIAVVVGLASIMVMAGSNTLIVSAALPQMRGRMVALYTTMVIGALPIGGPIAGAIAEAAGARAGLGIAAVFTILPGWFVRRTSLRRSAAPPPAFDGLP